MNREIDVRHVLPSIQVPTLIVHGTGDTGCTDRRGALHADRIGGARLVEISGGRQSMAGAELDPGLDEVESFLREVWNSGGWDEPEPERVLATVLFSVAGESTGLQSRDR